MAGGGTETGIRSPHWDNCLSQRKKHLRLKVKQLICGSLNGMRIRQTLPQPYVPWTGMQVPWSKQWLGAVAKGLWSNPRVRAAVDYGEAYSSPATRGSKKDSDKAITPALRQSMSLHTWHHQGSCDQSSSTTFRLNPHWGRVATCKKKKKKESCIYPLWMLQLCPTLCEPVDCDLPGFSVRGILQARILEYIGHYWLPYTSKTLYFLLP